MSSAKLSFQVKVGKIQEVTEFYLCNCVSSKGWSSSQLLVLHRLTNGSEIFSVAFMIRGHWGESQYIKYVNLESLIQVLASLSKQKYVSVALGDLSTIYYRKHVLAKTESCVKQRLHEIGDCWQIWCVGGVKCFYYKVSLFLPFYVMYLWFSKHLEHLGCWVFIESWNTITFIAWPIR